jgi:hypothetical protein
LENNTNAPGYSQQICLQFDIITEEIQIVRDDAHPIHVIVIATHQAGNAFEALSLKFTPYIV